MDSLVGMVLDGRYRVRRLLGRGGMGAVWEAEQLRLGRTVALKTLHSSLAGRPEVVERFRREAMAAASVGSPHIVDVYDLGVLPRGAPFMVMEYLPGQDLAELIAERGPLAPGDAVHVLTQACDALGAAHEAGIVHRDVKSENVMVLVRRGDPLFVKVVDFGVSKLRDSSLTGTADLLGTPYAMAPEQLRASRDVDARADVYALGVVLHHALSGRLPFEAATLPALIVAITEGQPRSLREVRPGLPAALYDIVEAAMARDPAARFQSCAALASALRSVEVASAPAPDAFAATMAVEPAGPADEPAPGLGAPRTERGFAAPGEDGEASGGDGEVGVRTRHGFAEASSAPAPPGSAPEAGTFSAEPASLAARGSPPQPGRRDRADAEEARGSARATPARGSLAPWIVLLVLLGGGGLAAAYRAELRAAWRNATATPGARGAGAANEAPPDEPAHGEGAAPAGGVGERAGSPPPPGRTESERAVSDRAVSVRAVPDREVPDRAVPDRVVPGRIVPTAAQARLDRLGEERAPSARPAGTVRCSSFADVDEDVALFRDGEPLGHAGDAIDLPLAPATLRAVRMARAADGEAREGMTLTRRVTPRTADDGRCLIAATFGSGTLLFGTLRSPPELERYVLSHRDALFACLRQPGRTDVQLMVEEDGRVHWYRAENASSRCVHASMRREVDASTVERGVWFLFRPSAEQLARVRGGAASL